jgi:CHAT domain-containing protein
VVASLWYVGDEPAMQLITDFYKQLRLRPELTKSQALRQAQIGLLQERRFQHPAYWAPFLLIGNWL